MDLSTWRDSLLDELKRRASDEAMEAIHRIEGERPDLPWLRSTAREVEELAMAEAWTGLSVPQVLGLGRPGQWSPITTPNGLMELTVRVLAEVQSELQEGDARAARDLWNAPRRGGNKKRWSPKDEEDIAHWLERRLKRAVLGHQVTVIPEKLGRRTEGARKGQRFDLVMGKQVPKVGGGTESIECVVEIKGCFNSGLTTAMETQLVEDYLRNGRPPVGIYLVVWFDKESWNDPGDQRRKAKTLERFEKAKLNTIDDLRKLLEGQAMSLTSSDYRVVSVVLDASLS
jgi:hypothetical protein